MAGGSRGYGDDCCEGARAEMSGGKTVGVLCGLIHCERRLRAFVLWSLSEELGTITAFVTTSRPGECFTLTRRSSSEPLSLGGSVNRGLGRGNELCGRGDADGRLG